MILIGLLIAENAQYWLQIYPRSIQETMILQLVLNIIMEISC